MIDKSYLKEYQPKNPDVKVWHYMRIDKLICLLRNKALPLTWGPFFDDKDEGGMSKREQQTILQIHSQVKIPTPYKMMASTSVISQSYALCWHMDEIESDQMWVNKEIAIQTTYRKLRDIAHENDFHMGVVKYVDIDESEIPSGVEKFLRKDESYSWEKEVRVFTFDSSSAFPLEKLLNIENIENFIEGIFVNPGSVEEQYCLVKYLLATSPHTHNGIVRERLIYRPRKVQEFSKDAVQHKTQHVVVLE